MNQVIFFFEEGILNNESQFKFLESQVQYYSIHDGKNFNQNKIFRLDNFINLTDE